MARKPEAKDDLQRLLAYYLACVEEEDRRSLELSADPRYSQFVTPAGEPGALFRGAADISWTPSVDDRKFFSKYTFDVGKQRYLYGYPVFFDNDGHVAPLFFSEVEVSRAEPNGRVTLHLTHPGSLQVNLHLFKGTHSMALERLELQDHFEGPDFGTIDARVAGALTLLGVSPKDLTTISRAANRGWKNAAIVFRDSGTMFTAHLRRELSELKARRLAAENTALGALLGSDGSPPSSKIPILEITALNQSQRSAVEYALGSPITVITGPPGTGKSQVVVAMMASMGAAGASVLFASKNNQAVDVVRERLAALLGDADWFLRLGSKNNIEEDLTQKVAAAETLATRAPLLQAPAHNLATLCERRDAVESAIDGRSERIARFCSELEGERAALSALTEEWRDWALSAKGSGIFAIDRRADVRRAASDVFALASGGWPGLWLWWKRLLFGARLLDQYRQTLSSITMNGLPQWLSSREPSWISLRTDYQNLLGVMSLSDVRTTLNELRGELASSRPNKALEAERQAASEAIQAAACAIARHKILARVHGQSRRLPTLLNEYRDLTQKAAKLSQKASGDIQAAFGRAARAALDAVPGVVVTSLSARRSLPMSAGMFDCLIIDEASQCDIASALPLLLRAKRLVIIGDPKQLRHISSLTEHSDQKLAAEHKATDLLAKYSYRTKSLYDCAAEAVEDRGAAPFFLDEHYRSHPEIVEFSNRLYYRRRLILRTAAERASEQAVFWHDVPASLADGRGSLLNTSEAEAVRDIALRVVTAPSFDPQWTLGIVTPFRRQRERIEQLFRESSPLAGLGPRLTIGTVHTFQGAEADVIIFSPVVAKGTRPRAAEWISSEEGLLNVALTRARKALHIVGDRSFCSETPGPLGELAKFVQQRAGVAQAPRRDSPPVQVVRAALESSCLWYQEEFPENTDTRTYYLDFVTVGLSGIRYNIEVDGRQHYFSPEAIAEDKARDAVLKAAGYRVIRVRSADVAADPARIKTLIASLA